jgi:hypothetical protein
MKALSSWNGRMEQDSGEGEYAADRYAKTKPFGKFAERGTG